MEQHWPFRRPLRVPRKHKQDLSFSTLTHPHLTLLPLESTLIALAHPDQILRPLIKINSASGACVPRIKAFCVQTEPAECFNWCLFSVLTGVRASRMTMDVKAEPHQNKGSQDCAGCGKRITERSVSHPRFHILAPLPMQMSCSAHVDALFNAHPCVSYTRRLLNRA